DSLVTSVRSGVPLSIMEADLGRVLPGTSLTMALLFSLIQITLTAPSGTGAEPDNWFFSTKNFLAIAVKSNPADDTAPWIAAIIFSLFTFLPDAAPEASCNTS